MPFSYSLFLSIYWSLWKWNLLDATAVNVSLGKFQFIFINCWCYFKCITLWFVYTAKPDDYKRNNSCDNFCLSLPICGLCFASFRSSLFSLFLAAYGNEESCEIRIASSVSYGIFVLSGVGKLDIWWFYASEEKKSRFKIGKFREKYESLLHYQIINKFSHNHIKSVFLSIISLMQLKNNKVLILFKLIRSNFIKGLGFWRLNCLELD